MLGGSDGAQAHAGADGALAAVQSDQCAGVEDKDTRCRASLSSCSV
jgi:hypothetical protein